MAARGAARLGLFCAVLLAASACVPTSSPEATAVASSPSSPAAIATARPTVPSPGEPGWTTLGAPIDVSAAIDPGHGAVIRDAVGFGRGFVLVGSRTVGSEVDGLIESSPDGLHWTQADLVASGLENAEVDHVATNGTRAIAIGLERTGHPISVARHVEWVSDDGRAWRRVDASALLSLASLPDAYGGLAGGSGGFEAWSTWSEPTGGPSSSFVSLLHSGDGLQWTEVRDVQPFSVGVLHALAGYGTGFVAAGLLASEQQEGGATWWSPDGLTWTEATIARPVFLRRVLPASSAVFVSGFDVGGFGIHPTTVWRSTDGSRWTFHEVVQGGNLPSQTWIADGRRVVVIDVKPGSRTGSVAATTDGTTWSSVGRVPAAPSYLSGSYLLGSSGLLVRMPPPDDAHPDVHQTLFVPAS